MLAKKSVVSLSPEDTSPGSLTLANLVQKVEQRGDPARAAVILISHAEDLIGDRCFLFFAKCFSHEMGRDENDEMRRDENDETKIFLNFLNFKTNTVEVPPKNTKEAQTQNQTQNEHHAPKAWT
jgi:hypothetical protein